MSLGSRTPFRLTRMLGFRLAVMMTLAILPLGLISILQTSRVTETLQQHARISVLAQTEQTALGERRIVLSALGAARALGAALPELSSDLSDCRSYLAQFILTNPRYLNASFLPPSGQVECTANGSTADLSDDAVFRSQIAEPRVRLSSNNRGATTGRQVVVLTVPIFREDVLSGFVSLSMPYVSVMASADGQTVDAPLSTVMFNDLGEIVTVRLRPDESSDYLPQGVDLRDLVRSDSRVFIDEIASGKARTFAVVPLIPGTAYVMSSWPPPTERMSDGYIEAASIAFPLAMWAASLVVGYLAIHRLVVRHVRSLGRDMRVFARSRRFDPSASSSGMSDELAAIHDEFLRMAEMILRDEAALEGALREKNDLLAQKNVLMKEVHHRVKNNLQLISSIMNMQIRKSRSVETKAIVQRLQERVLGLATVHRNLYQAGDLGAIDAGQLVREISEQMLAVGAGGRLNTEISVESIILFPDQAVPLSLLTAESVTNALKYSGSPDEAPWIRISLKRSDSHHATFHVLNSLNDMAVPGEDTRSDGLGTQLIRAFSAQLDSEVQITQTDRTFSVSVTFPIEDFRPPEDEPARPARETV